MSTKQFRIEILIAGFSHLLWMTFLAILILGKSTDMIFCFISDTETGIGVILSAIIVGVSYYLGMLAEHSLSTIIYFCGDEDKRARIIGDHKGNSHEIYANKIFFLSMAVAIPLIVILLLLINRFEYCSLSFTILIIGTILEFGNVISTIYWVIITRKPTSKSESI